MEINVQIEYLREKLLKAQVPFNEKQIEQFRIYLVELLQWNRRTNLISKNDEEHVVSRHFLESLSLLSALPIPEHSRVIDVGTGAGFPGLPIKIIRPDLRITLLDSKRFRILFLNDVVSKLNISGIEIFKERAEILSANPNFSQKYDFVFARAVTQLDKLYLWTHQFLKDDGSILTFKGGDIENEMDMVKKKFKVNVYRYSLSSSFTDQNRMVELVRLSLKR